MPLRPSAGPLLLIILLAIGVIRIALRAQRGSTFRRAALRMPATFRSRVSVKYRYGAIPGWAQRVKGPMELRIRDGLIEVSMASALTGALFGVNRYLNGPETDVTTNPEQAPSRESGWIVLTGTQRGKPIEVAILPHGPRDEVLLALRSAGA